jgi:hypothetical protein
VVIKTSQVSVIMARELYITNLSLMSSQDEMKKNVMLKAFDTKMLSSLCLGICDRIANNLLSNSKTQLFCKVVNSYYIIITNLCVSHDKLLYSALNESQAVVPFRRIEHSCLGMINKRSTYRLRSFVVEVGDVIPRGES